ncbi:unnamed protein product [Moneuplotes crassus]|uniref:Uncharacterized protein n=1 Tax=Euplotes crassus TaxID=5936 RepID=A0AAD1UJ41_EUPCR|nr:unnamed protein product [Moneuplotes crassus]
MSQSQGRYEPIKAYTKSDKAESRRVSPVHSEDKFKSAENIFIPDVESDKQMYSKEYVDELQSFYQNERESLKLRIDRIYKENDDSKIKLLDQINYLNAQLEENSEKHKTEMIKLNEEKSNKLARIIREKDTLLTESKDQIYELKNELSKMTLKYTDLNEDFKRVKFDLQSQVDNLTQQLNNQVEIFDCTKGDYEYRINSSRERFDLDRDQLKKEYEKLISSMRSEHKAAQEDLSKVIQAKKKEISCLRKDMGDLKLSFNTRINDLEASNYDLVESLKSSQKIADMQMAENKKLISRKISAQKEVKMAKKEMEVMREEYLKAIKENRELEGRISKLDKLVYGANLKTKKTRL